MTASCAPTRGVSERNSGEEGTNSGPDAAGADMARLTAGLPCHVGSPRLLTVDHGASPPKAVTVDHGDGPPGPVFFFFSRPPPGQGGRPGGFVYPGLTTPAAVCLYWARPPAAHDGLFILGPSPSSAIRGARRAAQNRNNNQGGAAQTPQKNNKQGDPKGRGRQPANTNLEPKRT